MDELVPSTPDDLTALFVAGLNRALGTSGDRFERRAFVKRMTRKLAKHFDAVGWPQTKQEALTYVNEAINRYC